MNLLSKLPNIGKELENRLNNVGINSADEFKRIGSQKAFQLLHASDPTTCINTLMALEGAIQQIRWHDLDPVKKQELNEFFQLLNRKIRK
jgi:DNA transformation protein and related proteins